MDHSAQKAVNSFLQKSSIQKIGIWGTLLVLIFVCQFGMLCYFNFTQLPNHMGYDSSWNYLRSAMMWQEKAISFHNWHDDTNLQLDTHMLLTSLLYGLTGNIWLAYGIGNTLLVIGLLYFLRKVLVRLNVRFTARMIALNLVICPYLSNGFTVFNDLGYFSSVLSGASFYGLRMLVVLMIFHEFLKIVQEQKMGVPAWFAWAGCTLCGFSSGVYLLIIILIPYLAYEIEMAAIRNDWRQLIRKESLFALLCCFFVIAGKILAGRLIGYTAIDSTSTWTALKDLWTNFGALLPGYMKLLQVLPLVNDSYYPVVSATGILRLCTLAIFALIIISVVYVFRRVLKNLSEQNGPLLFLANAVLINFLILGLNNASYGAIIFEERYLIVVFFMMVIMTALFFNSLDSRRVISVMLSAVMAASVCMVDIHSDINYLKVSNDKWSMKEIQSLAESQNAGIVYIWGDDLTVISRSLRILDLNRVYKSIPDGGEYYRHHWGDYLTYDTNEEYTGPTMLICPKGQNLVPESVLKEFTFLDDSLGYEVLSSTGQLEVYVSDHNPKLF